MMFVTNFLSSPSLTFAIFLYLSISHLVVKFLKIQIFSRFFWINAMLHRLTIVKYTKVTEHVTCISKQVHHVSEWVFLLRLNIFNETRLQLNDKGMNNKSKYFFGY